MSSERTEREKMIKFKCVKMMMKNYPMVEVVIIFWCKHGKPLGFLPDHHHHETKSTKQSGFWSNQIESNLLFAFNFYWLSLSTKHGIYASCIFLPMKFNMIFGKLSQIINIQKQNDKSTGCAQNAAKTHIN